MLGWLDHQLADLTSKLLEEVGISEIDPDTWYNFQTFLDIQREIVNSKNNVTMTLVSVGKATAGHLPISDFETLADFKAFVEGLHDASTRNTPPHEKHLLIEEDDTLYLVNNTPVANDLLYGFWWGVLNRYKVAGESYIPIPHQDYPSNDIGSIFMLELK